MSHTHIEEINFCRKKNKDELEFKTFEFNYKGFYIPDGELFGRHFLKEVCVELLDDPTVPIYIILLIIRYVMSTIIELKEPTNVIFNIYWEKDEGHIREIPDEYKNKEEELIDSVWFAFRGS